MQLFIVDDKRELLIAENEEIATIFAAVRFVGQANQAIKERGSFSVALSGGSTPKKLYEYLKNYPRAETEIDWTKVNFFWSDERAVPLDHQESNYRMAMNFFNKEPFDVARKFPMPAFEEDKEKAAKLYEAQITKYCTDGRFDLVLLGVGDDGHTASLFPGTDAVKNEKDLVCSVFIPEKNSYRMTLTFPCINNARKIMVLVNGAGKAEIMKTVLIGEKNYEKYPAQKIGQEKTAALFIIDEPASLALPMKLAPAAPVLLQEETEDKTKTQIVSG